MSERLVPSDRAPGLLVAPEVVVPEDAEIAPYVTIHSGVSLGAGVSLQQGAIIGRPQWIDGRGRIARRPPGDATVLGAGCQVGSYTVVTAGAELGAGSYLGDHVGVRENAWIGEHVMVGRNSVVGLQSRICARVRVHGYALLGSWTVLEEDVVAGPRVSFVTDPTLGRRAAHTRVAATVVRRASRLGAGAIIFAPAAIGEEAVVGAGSIVRADVEARTVVAGAPARVIRAVRDDELFEEWQ
jgi:UDP-2-acetamido-3-amino-2,3-dideoxy-glucuronate N-acetyltransferase